MLFDYIFNLQTAGVKLYNIIYKRIKQPVGKKY